MTDSVRYPRSVNEVTPGRTAIRNFDKPLLFVVVTLAAFGMLMVYSASIALADGPNFGGVGQYYFVGRHLMYMGVGILLALLVWLTPLEVMQRMTIPLFILTTILLVLVFMPVIGREVKGANRWLSLGVINFQPSELAKLAVVMYAADYAVRKKDKMKSFVHGFLPIAISVGAVGLLVLLEPDLGALTVLMVITVGVLFLGGINGWLFSGLMLLLPSLFFLAVWLAPWRRARLFAYMDPWDPSNMYGSAYQLSHSLIAVGRGEWLGVGLGSSIEKLHYLPEAHTDFIISVIGEELGFVGIALVVILFALMIQRMFEIGRQAISMDRLYSGLVAQGVGIWFGVQIFINVGVCLGLLPTKGLTMPLISYGGSGLVMNLIAIALVMRVDYETRVLMRGGRV